MNFFQPFFTALLFAPMFFVCVAEAAEAKPLKVFILAGQSNMEGHAKIETFDYIGDDSATAPLLKKMRKPDGTPKVCDGAWISYFTGRGDDNGEGFGKLTAGYGSRSDPAEDGGKIGPEFTFGIAMDSKFDEPVLIIKTAWGGKSLFYDFRPPGAGVYQRSEKDIEKDRYPEARSGHYYRLMLTHVKSVLGDISRIVPSYDEKQGYEIAGFVWFQGFNDMVNRDVYPPVVKNSSGNRFAKYSGWMAAFIRDVRKDLDAPEMPFVIGVMGVGGKNANPDNLKFREAMSAPVKLPEFENNVAAVPTSPFWDEPLGAIAEKYQKVRQMSYLLRTEKKGHANEDGTMSKQDQKVFLKKFETDLVSPEEVALRERGSSNQGYHYLGCAKTFAVMGQAFAEALLDMMEDGTTKAYRQIVRSKSDTEVKDAISKLSEHYQNNLATGKNSIETDQALILEAIPLIINQMDDENKELAIEVFNVLASLQADCLAPKKKYWTDWWSRKQNGESIFWTVDFLNNAKEQSGSNKPE